VYSLILCLLKEREREKDEERASKCVTYNKKIFEAIARFYFLFGALAKLVAATSWAWRMASACYAN
jgi:hypothetical protein